MRFTDSSAVFRKRVYKGHPQISEILCHYCVMVAGTPLFEVGVCLAWLQLDIYIVCSLTFWKVPLDVMQTHSCSKGHHKEKLCHLTLFLAKFRPVNWAFDRDMAQSRRCCFALVFDGFWLYSFLVALLYVSSYYGVYDLFSLTCYSFQNSFWFINIFVIVSFGFFFLVLFVFLFWFGYQYCT